MEILFKKRGHGENKEGMPIMFLTYSGTSMNNNFSTILKVSTVFKNIIPLNRFSLDLPKKKDLDSGSNHGCTISINGGPVVPFTGSINITINNINS